MNRAVFLDRDGVINHKAPEGEWITRWEDLRFLPRVADAISVLKRAGFRVVVISNQRCVARGLISSHDLELIHQRMCTALARDGAGIDAIYYCPHEKDVFCDCRKPAPGMLLRAQHEHGIDLSASWMVGDSESDIATGKNAGCRTVLLLLNRHSEASAADLVARSLLEATHKILQLENSSVDPASAALSKIGSF
jgi:D-glycero-D-manno-heptose 1,7-bisphosphate phosphatase